DARSLPPARSDELMGRLLGKGPEPSPATAPVPRDAFEALIHHIVAPHVVPDTSAQTAAYLAAVDSALAEQMRAGLHAPSFQSLEALWRGVRWLIANLELDEHLQLHLLDITRDELIADIVAAKGKLAETDLYRAIVDRSRVPGDTGWTALVAALRFGPSNT